MLKSILKAFLLILSGTGIKASTKSDLTSLEWKNRLVIVNIKKDDHKSMNDIESWLKTHKCYNEEQNLKVIHFTDGENQYYQTPTYLNMTGTWLIGYDGEIKAFSKQLDLLDQIHSLIDQMPIRKTEIEQQKSRC